MVPLIALFFFGILVGVTFLMAVGIYNGLVSLRKQVDKSWVNIDVILKQNFDEVPQLLQGFEQFTGREKAILEKINEARSHYLGAKKIDEQIKASNEMTNALAGMLAIGEAYPELKSNKHFKQLQNKLSTLEDQIADSREHFNDSVTVYNTRTEQFPDVFFAQALGYAQLELIQVQDFDESLPSVQIKSAA